MQEIGPFQYYVLLIIPYLAISAASHRYLLPTPTLGDSRAAHAQVDFEIRPTPNPWSSSELLKRLSGDPGICGWIEGNSSEFADTICRPHLRDPDNTVSCNSGYTCAATSTFVGCCSTGAVGCDALFTTCYGSSGPSCKGSCLLNSAALIW